MDETHVRRWLAEFLGRERDGLVTSVVDRVQGIPRTRYARRPREQVHEWAARGLDVLVASLKENGQAVVAAHALHMGEDRQARGFRLEDVIGATHCLERVVIEALLEASAGGAPEAAAASALVGPAVRSFVALFARRFSETMQASVDAERARTSLTLGAMEAAGASLDLDVVLEHVARDVASALRVPWCGIVFPDEPGERFVPRAMAGVLGSDHLARLQRRAFERGADDVIRAPLGRRAPIVFRRDDGRCLLCGEDCRTGGVASAVAFPIIRGERELAVALAATSDPHHRFEEAQIQLAWGLTKLVAPAVDNARLHAATRRQLDESRALQEIMRALNAAESLASVLDVVCREARELTGVTGCAVVMDDESEGEHRSLVSCDGPACGHEGLPALVDLVCHGGGFPATSSRQEDLVIPTADGTPYRLRAALSVPLRDAGDVFGVLLLCDETRALGGEEERVAQLFADHAAMAFRSERLRRERERVAVLEDRERLSHDLHDSVSQSLYGVTMYAEAATRVLLAGQPQLAVSHLENLRDESFAALRHMRLLIFELRPPDLRERGLVAALEARILAVEARSGVKAKLDSNLAERLAYKVEHALFGITQEALNNALRHARASSIRVRLRRDGGIVRLEIEDDGVGFELEEGRREGGLGLRGMSERAERIGATLSVVPGRHGGARVIVEVPSPLGTGGTPETRPVSGADGPGEATD